MEKQAQRNDMELSEAYTITNWKQVLINMFKGAVIGVGAILPGLSGGVLCVVFGIYKPMMNFLSHPLKSFKAYYRLLLPILIGLAIGFLGLARLIDILFRTSQAPAIWLFIGLIVGTLPSLFRTAGEKGRTKGSWAVFAACFVLFVAMMTFFNMTSSILIEPSIFWWAVCGIIWGLGLIVPGLSSSTFLIFLGLYQPLTAGIASISLGVIIPFIAGLGLVVLLFSRLVNWLFDRAYSIMYHALLGIVLASTIAIIPYGASYSAWNVVLYAVCFAAGCTGGLFIDKLNGRIKTS